MRFLSLLSQIQKKNVLMSTPHVTAAGDFNQTEDGYGSDGNNICVRKGYQAGMRYCMLLRGWGC